MKRIYIFILFLAGFFFILSCRHETPSVTVSSQSELVNDTLSGQMHEDHVHNVGRAIWQKPRLVIDKLGDLSEKTVADIGAGTGYFSYRLAKNAKKVIAIDIEQGMLNYIDSMKQKMLPDPDQKLITRLATPQDPGLENDEADIVLIINTIAYIPKLTDYLQTLRKGLKPDGTLMIIDYKMKRLPINAPPKSERIYLDKLEDMLIDGGYEVVETDDTSLDYQYIIQARNKE